MPTVCLSLTHFFVHLFLTRIVREQFIETRDFNVHLCKAQPTDDDENDGKSFTFFARRCLRDEDAGQYSSLVYLINYESYTNKKRYFLNLQNLVIKKMINFNYF